MKIYGRRAKRWLDVVAATSLFVVTSPILCAAILLSLMSQGQPVLFRQVRAGRNGVPFTVLKLRTMDQGRNGDPRARTVTRIGRILRQLSIDELPQLVNIIRGDMSIVGPRPLHVRYVERYSAEQRVRLEVAPGLTGAAQVAGRNRLTWEEKFELDTEYVRGLSFLIDVKILVQTVGVVARARRNQSTTERGTEFMGTVVDT